jgi:hypothetical protein
MCSYSFLRLLFVSFQFDLQDGLGEGPVKRHQLFLVGAALVLRSRHADPFSPAARAFPQKIIINKRVPA